MSKKSKQIASHILIVIFTLYYANICFFYHGHIINGATIVHSHFHNQAHSEKGTHSDSELTLISTLSAFQTLQATLCFMGLGIILLIQAIIRPFLEDKILQKSSACITLRAPPYLY